MSGFMEHGCVRSAAAEPRGDAAGAWADPPRCDASTSRLWPTPGSVPRSATQRRVSSGACALQRSGICGRGDGACGSPKSTATCGGTGIGYLRTSASAWARSWRRGRRVARTLRSAGGRAVRGSLGAKVVPSVPSVVPGRFGDNFSAPGQCVRSDFRVCPHVPTKNDGGTNGVWSAGARRNGPAQCRHHVGTDGRRSSKSGNAVSCSRPCFL